MKKKITAALLAACLLLSGCSEGGSQDNPAQTKDNAKFDAMKDKLKKKDETTANTAASADGDQDRGRIPDFWNNQEEETTAEATQPPQTQPVASAATTTTAAQPVVGLEFEDNGSGVTVINYTGSGETAEIPMTYEGKRVSRIGANAFSGHTELKKVSVPFSVNGIDETAFSGCENIEVVYKGSTFGYDRINELYDAINGRSAEQTTVPEETAETTETTTAPVVITAVTTRPPVTTTAQTTTTTAQTTKPEAQTAPASDFTVDTVSGGVRIKKYKGSSSEVVIPGTINGKTVIEIGSNAFDGSSVKSVVIPKGVKVIGDEAFFNCKKLTSITIPSTVKEIGSSAFWLCTGLTNVTLPDGVKSVGSGAFDRCENIKIKYKGKSYDYYSIADLYRIIND